MNNLLHPRGLLRQVLWVEEGVPKRRTQSRSGSFSERLQSNAPTLGLA